MQTILCSYDRRQEVLHKLFEMSQSKVIHTNITSYRNLFHAKDEENEGVFLLRCKKIFEKEKLKIYKKMIVYPEFIQEIVSFARECALWGIAPSTLPTDTDAEKELKKLVELVPVKKLKENAYYNQYNEVLQNVLQQNDVMIVPSFEKEYFFYQFQKELLSKKTNAIPSIFKPEIPSVKELRYAATTRIEIESCAQEIVSEPKKSYNIVLCDYENQYPVLKQIFQRYKIPFTAKRNNTFLKMPKAFRCLTQFALYKDVNHFMDCLINQAFSKECPQDVIAFYSDTLTSDETTGEILFPKQIKNNMQEYKREILAYNQTQAKATAYLKSIKKEYQLLIGGNSPQEDLKNAYEVWSKNPLLQNEEEFEVAKKIRALLVDVLDEIQTLEDAEFFIQSLRNPVVEVDMKQYDSCIVTDLSHPVDVRDVTYVLGSNAKNYPNVPKQKGLFDETYLKKVKGYPSFEDRYKAHMEQIEWVFNCSKKLVFSYITTDYQGREVIPSYQVKSRMPEAVPWSIQEQKPFQPKDHRIDASLAEELFTAKDQKIHGSISSIEKYFYCPYCYFLKSGLKLKEIQSLEYSSATIGSIGHAYYEEMTSQHGKKYADYVTEKNIEKTLKPHFDLMVEMYPPTKWMNTYTKERLKEEIVHMSIFLREMENDNAFIPVASEYEYTSDMFPHLALNGKIDRIDETDHYFRIIDYKSSKHKLEQKNIKAGIQLQLLTYLLVYEQICKKQPEGAYYISFKQNESAKTEAGKYGHTKGEIQPQTPDYFNAVANNARRLKGWKLMDNMGTYQDFKKYHDAATVHDKALIEQCLNELYEYFVDHLLSGDIELKPVEGACTYCKYKAICRLRGPVNEITPRVMEDVKI